MQDVDGHIRRRRDWKSHVEGVIHGYRSGDNGGEALLNPNDVRLIHGRRDWLNERC